MAHRRALIVAPLYDGGFLPALAGTKLLVERLEPTLLNHGGYDVKTLTGPVTQIALRRAMEHAFDTEGEVLVYFYGHGCVRHPGVVMLATSDGQAYSEGIAANDFTLFAQQSKAREVVLILDCCHAGAALTLAGTNQLREEAAQFIRTAGRALLAACSENQQGWEVKDANGKKLGAFSLHVLDGLVAKGVLPGCNHVTASSLSNYVLEAFRAWNQTPVCLTHETGERKCIITSNLEPPRPKAPASKKEPLRINLPFKPSTTFVGRSAELDYLKALLIDGSRPIAVSATIEGLGGIGKTELVLQLLYDADVSNAFASIVWLDAAGPLPPQWASAIQRLGENNAPSDAADILSLVTKQLEDRGRSLVVLDNATDWESVRRYIPDGYPLLVTTRTKDFGGTDFQHRELGNLSDESARDFLIQLVPTLRTDPALPFLIQALAGHALAIELAGYHIKDMCSAGEYLTQLRRNEVVFSRDALGKTHYQATVDACLEITWNSLKRDASRLLWRKASLFAPTSAHRDLLQASFAPLGRDNWELQDLLHEMGYKRDRWEPPIGIKEDFNSAYAELRGCHVLARVEGFNGERWAMHRLVRDFARKRLQKGELVMHSLILSSWLRTPSLPLQPEVPHFVVAILDFAREGRGFDLSRRLDREIGHRSPRFFESSYMVEFLRDQLDDPKAIVQMFEGLRDINEDVRIAAIRLMEQAGPTPEVLNGLASALNDPDPQVRQLASETLSKHGGTRTIEVLVAAIESPNPRARLAAVSALGLMGGQADAALRKVAQEADGELQLEAATLLAEHGDSSGASTVLAAIQTDTNRHTNRHVRALRAVMANTGADTALLRGLAELLKSANAPLRDFVATELGQINDRKTVDVLAEVITEGNREATKAAVKALGLVGDKAHAVLRAVADKGGDPDSKIEAATLLAEQKDATRSTIVIGSIDVGLDEQSLVRRLNALRALKSETVESALRPVLKRTFAAMSSKPEERRLHVALALAELGENDGIAVISSWLAKNYTPYSGDEANRALRLAVALCLPPDVVRHVVAGLKSWLLKDDAAKLLGNLRDRKFVPHLLEALTDKDNNVRKQVATVLGKIGDPAARIALEKVALEDGDADVRAAATKALKDLKPK